MMPGAFVILDELPYLPNGKINLRALPKPEADRFDGAGSFVPPRTAAERELAKMFCDVLGLEEVGIHDNFFELGGDSILSLRIVARAKEAGLALSPKVFFNIQQFQS
jgi:hypothetical protein